MKKNRVRFIPYDEIGKVAKSVLEKYELSENIPVDIERLLEHKLKINIIPHPLLLKSNRINSYTSSDFKDIYVDEYLIDRLEFQYRFTLAHEYGHMVLHKYFYTNEYKNGFKSINEYKGILSSISRDEYDRLEYQANCFAGHLLVPTSHLKNLFKSKLKRYIYSITKEIGKFNREDVVDYITSIISKELESEFKVHYKAIKVRIDKEKLADMIIS